MAIGTPTAGTLAETSSATSLAVPYPASPGAGDYLLVFVSCSASSSTQYPEDPSSVFTNIIHTRSGSSSPSATWFGKVATGSESGSYTFNLNSSAVSGKGQMWKIPGVDNTTPVEDSDSFGTGSATADKSVPALTTSVTGCQIWAAAAVNNTTSTWTTPSSPGTFTDALNDPSPNPSTYVGYLTWGSSGSTGSILLDHSSSVRGLAIGLALRPAPSGTNFTRSADDDSGLTDSGVVRGIFGTNQEDAGLSDSASTSLTSVNNYTQTFDDSALSTDSPDLNKNIVGVSADDAGLADSASLVAVLGRSSTDDSGITDSIVIARGVVPTDGEGLSDTQVYAAGKAITDGAGTADSQTYAQTYAKTDNSGLTDSTSVLGSHIIAATDSAGSTDTQGLAYAGVRSFDDNGGLTDTSTVARVVSLSFTDDAGSTDTQALVKVFATTVTDSVGSTDTQTFEAAHVITDTVGNTDSAQSGSLLPQTFTDAAGTTDVLQLGYALVVTDGVGATDNSQLVHGIVQASTDDSGTTDGIASSIGRGVSSTDSTGLTDAAQLVSGMAQIPTDNAGLSDSIVMVINSTITDSTGLVDTQAFASSGGLIQNDSEALGDEVVISRAVVISDASGSGDVASPSLGISPSLTDSSGLTDSVTVSVGRGVSISEGAGTTDSISISRGISISDILGLSDDQSLSSSGSNTVADNSGLADSVSFVLNTVATDSAGLVDSQSSSSSGSASSTDNAGLADSIVLVQSKVVADSSGNTDTQTVSSGRSIGQTDNIGLADSVSLVQSKVVAVTDAMGTSDSRVTDRVLVPIDSIGSTDTNSISTSGGQNITDTSGLTDSVASSQAKVIGDGTGIADSPVRTGLEGIATNSAGMTDSATAVIVPPTGLTPTFTEPVGVTDTGVVFGLAGVDFVGLADVPTVVLDTGGDDYWTETLNDLQNLTDSPARIGQAGTANNSVGLTDSVNVAKGVAQTVAVTDSLGLTDLTAGREDAWSDSAGMNDSFSMIGAGTNSPIDIMGLTDAASVILTRPLTITDNIGNTDVAAQSLSKQIADNAATSDGMGLALDYVLEFNDREGMADSPAFDQKQTREDFVQTFDSFNFVSVTNFSGVTESLNLSDTVKVEAAHIVAQTDGVGSTDIRGVAQSKVVQESTGLTDPIAITHSLVFTDSTGSTDIESRLSTIVRPIDDRVVLVDVTSRAGFGTLSIDDSENMADESRFVFAKVVNDSVGLKETFAHTRPTTDSAGTTDSVIITRGMVVNERALNISQTLFAYSAHYSDAVQMSDDTATVQSKSRIDSIGITDQAGVNHSTSISDQTNLSDSVAITRGKGVNDSVGSSDRSGLTYALLFTDNEGTSDNTQRLKETDLVLVDGVGVVDSLGQASRDIVVVDPFTVTETLELEAALFRTLPDTIALTDSATVRCKSILAAWPYSEMERNRATAVMARADE